LRLALLALLAPSLAFAEVETSTSALVPPRALSATIAYPADAPLAAPIEIRVRISVDETGEVTRVVLLDGAEPRFARAVLEGAASFRFEPARYGGVPVPVEISFTQRFEPPPPPPPVLAALRGQLETRGRTRPVPFAHVVAEDGDRRVEVLADEAGRFAFALEPGEYTIWVRSAETEPFRQVERVEGELEVRYRLTPLSANPYEVVVRDQRIREVARLSLREKELTRVPGTFGDPFRVIGALPGVSAVMSLLPYPVVRGASPGNTGFLIDGVRVPLLFHLLAGPSVVHPSLIDRLDFFPGAFPVEHGGYTGGIVDGRTRPARPDEVAAEMDINLFQLGGMVRHPLGFGGLVGTAAGRYGYPGLLVGLASPRVTLSYFDYQLRLDGGDADHGFSLFFFGARDDLDTVPNGEPDEAEKEPQLQLQFHRLDLAYRRRGLVEQEHTLSLGYDASLTRAEAEVDSYYAAPRLRFTVRPIESLALRFGADAQARTADVAEIEGGPAASLLGRGGEPEDAVLNAGLLAEALWEPFDALLLRPGVRAELYTDTAKVHLALDPRILARLRVLDAESELWVKAGAGLFHQPPRFAIPVPGLDHVAFERGLLEAVHATVGAELRLPSEWSVDASVYFNWMDPIFFDLQANPSAEELLNAPPSAPPGQLPAQLPRDRDDLDDRLDALLAPATGRSYGLELLVRRETALGLSGWLAYTLSRSERLRDGAWVAFDFDRAHIVNLVLRLPLPRRWEIGMRAQVQSGRPLTTTAGLSEVRADTFFRLDLRIDKTAVWDEWLLDFYVDIGNVVLAAEDLAPGTALRYVLPTLGFRALF